MDYGVTEYEADSFNLFARDRNCRVRCDRYGNCRCHRWNSWGRWVVLGVVIIVFVLLALSCCCLARRRRKRGVQPFYGTGWMAPNHKSGGWAHNNNNHQMYNYNNHQQPHEGGMNPPPAYGQQPQYTGNTFNPNDGYYGQQQYPQAGGGGYPHENQYAGVQTPQAAYQGGYAPPPGPPPGK